MDGSVLLVSLFCSQNLRLPNCTLGSNHNLTFICFSFISYYIWLIIYVYADNGSFFLLLFFSFLWGNADNGSCRISRRPLINYLSGWVSTWWLVHDKKEEKKLLMTIGFRRKLFIHINIWHISNLNLWSWLYI